ncbi:MAG TPA: L,D-transpeptidase family protein [Allosphingosinicella sp.]
MIGLAPGPGDTLPRRHRRGIAKAVALAAALALAAMPDWGGSSPGSGVRATAAWAAAPAGPVRIEPYLPHEGTLADFYRARAFRPLWIDASGLKPEAQAVLDAVAGAATDGLAPERYRAAWLGEALAQARTGDPVALAKAELLLSRAYADYVADLRGRAGAADMMIVEEMALEPPSAGEVLDAAGATESLRDHVSAALELNPVYGGLRRGLADYRARWSKLPQVAVPEGPALAPGAAGERVALLRRRLGLELGTRFDPALGQAVRAFKQAHGLAGDAVADAETIAALNRGSGHYERVIRANLERARMLPADPAQRFVLVDAAAARLWLYEDGHAVDSMKVIVGKPGQETPAMAGPIRFAVLNPYWNVPPDLVPKRVAQRVLKDGAAALRRERFELLRDWSDDAPRIEPAAVDWKAVASGKRLLRVRQLPGPGNMMGRIKFMIPNKLGIYLHDTPNKALFDSADRRLSSGCVRVEDAARLARWLFGGAAPVAATDAPEQKVALPEAVPLFITYLTAAPSPAGIVFREDLDARDAALMAKLDSDGAGSRS